MISYDRLLIDYISDGQWGIIGISKIKRGKNKGKNRKTVIYKCEYIMELLDYMFDDEMNIEILEYSEAAEMMIESESIEITKKYEE